MTPRYFHRVANGLRFDGFGMLAAADLPMNGTTVRDWIHERARIGVDGFGRLAVADPPMNETTVRDRIRERVRIGVDGSGRLTVADLPMIGMNARGWIRERERGLGPALSGLHIWGLRLDRVGGLQLSLDKGYYAGRECKRDEEF